jgi:transposase
MFGGRLPKWGVRDRVARELIERFFNRIKSCRRVATRYDKLAELSGVRQTRINPGWAASA